MAVEAIIEEYEGCPVTPKTTGFDVISATEADMYYMDSNGNLHKVGLSNRAFNEKTESVISKIFHLTYKWNDLNKYVKLFELGLSNGGGYGSSQWHNTANNNKTTMEYSYQTKCEFVLYSTIPTGWAVEDLEYYKVALEIEGKFTQNVSDNGPINRGVSVRVTSESYSGFKFEEEYEILSKLVGSSGYEKVAVYIRCKRPLAKQNRQSTKGGANVPGGNIAFDFNHVGINISILSTTADITELAENFCKEEYSTVDGLTQVAYYYPYDMHRKSFESPLISDMIQYLAKASWIGTKISCIVTSTNWTGRGNYVYLEEVLVVSDGLLSIKSEYQHEFAIVNGWIVSKARTGGSNGVNWTVIGYRFIIDIKEEIVSREDYNRIGSVYKYEGAQALDAYENIKWFYAKKEECLPGFHTIKIFPNMESAQYYELFKVELCKIQKGDKVVFGAFSFSYAIEKNETQNSCLKGTGIVTVAYQYRPYGGNSCRYSVQVLTGEPLPLEILFTESKDEYVVLEGSKGGPRGDEYQVMVRPIDDDMHIALEIVKERFGARCGSIDLQLIWTTDTSKGFIDYFATKYLRSTYTDPLRQAYAREYDETVQSIPTSPAWESWLETGSTEGLQETLQEFPLGDYVWYDAEEDKNGNGECNKQEFLLEKEDYLAVNFDEDEVIKIIVTNGLTTIEDRISAEFIISKSYGGSEGVINISSINSFMDWDSNEHRMYICVPNNHCQPVKDISQLCYFQRSTDGKLIVYPRVDANRSWNISVEGKASCFVNQSFTLETREYNLFNISHLSGLFPYAENQKHFTEPKSLKLPYLDNYTKGKFSIKEVELELPVIRHKVFIEKNINVQYNYPKLILSNEKIAEAGIYPSDIISYTVMLRYHHVNSNFTGWFMTHGAPYNPDFDKIEGVQAKMSELPLDILLTTAYKRGQNEPFVGQLPGYRTWFNPTYPGWTNEYGHRYEGGGFFCRFLCKGYYDAVIKVEYIKGIHSDLEIDHYTSENELHEVLKS